MRIVCIIDTVATELRFITEQDAKTQLPIATELFAKFQPLNEDHQILDFALVTQGTVHIFCIHFSA